jgi:signal transduction histidine kinase
VTKTRGASLRTVFSRLMLAFGSVVITVVLLSSLILSDFVLDAFKRQFVDVMAQDAQGVALWAEPYMVENQVPADVLPHLPWLHAVTEGRLWLVNASGEVVADSGTGTNFRGRRPDHEWIRRVLAGEVLSETIPDPWLHSAITVGRPIKHEGRVVGAIFLFAAPARLRAVVTDFRLLIAVTALAAAAIGLFAAYGLARSFARPIEAMARFATGLGQQRFAGGLPASGIAELDRLAVALGDAGRQLEESFEAVSQQKQRFQSLIQEMAEGVVAVGPDQRIVLVNPAAGQLLGLPGPFDDLPMSGAGFPGPLTQALEQAVESEAGEPVTVTFACGGAEILARISLVRGGAVALLRDVTTEVQLKRLRENFVANVSHELRGPLASLSAGVEAMHDGLIPEPARPRYLKAFLSEIARLRRLVDDLLELSRLDAGILEITLEEFDLQPLCEGFLEKWAPRTAAAGVTLRVDSPHARVLANYDRVEEILSNFLDNAVRFTPAGGTIRVFARSKGDMVEVGVSDTGAGIAAEHLPHLWDRFYKVDPARTRTRGTGTGLGLSIVRQLVERLGGEVKVESIPGKGSVFSFTLVAARTVTEP